MCLVVFSYRVHPGFPLVVAANRDELYDRPTRPAAFWPEEPGLVAGRDERAGGTWLGITRSGRFAALTNFRDPRSRRPGAPSRGTLVTAFLGAGTPPWDWLEALGATAAAYDPFNLLAGDPSGLFVFESRTGAPREVAPGTHGLSNALLDTPWPKVVNAREALAARLARRPGAVDAEELLDLLRDEAVAPDVDLPDTGVGLEWERSLSPSFIRTPAYGTRSTTVLTIREDGAARLVERTYDPRDGASPTSAVELAVTPWPALPGVSREGARR